MRTLLSVSVTITTSLSVPDCKFDIAVTLSSQEFHLILNICSTEVKLGKLASAEK
jgi:hypothetical protein